MDKQTVKKVFEQMQGLINAIPCDDPIQRDTSQVMNLMVRLSTTINDEAKMVDFMTRFGGLMEELMDIADLADLPKGQGSLTAELVRLGREYRHKLIERVRADVEEGAEAADYLQALEEGNIHD